MFSLKLLPTLLLTASLAAMAMPGVTGLSGSVSLSPIRPGPQLEGAPTVAPMAKALVQVRSVDGHEVARTTTDDQGHFIAHVSAGDYIVTIDVQGAALPRCEAVHALVRDGQLTQVQISCDSGMR